MRFYNLMSETLLKINSKYILKEIFSYLNYDRTLKVIKTNKKLKKNLGINVLNYEERTDFQYIKNEKKITKIPYFNSPEILILYIPFFISTIITFIYVLIFAAILVSKGSFNENNTKDNYDKNYLKIIDKINLSLFGFLAYIPVSFFLLFWATINCFTDYAFLYLGYAAIIIVKLILSYNIKKDKITWFMICDYILICIIILHLPFFICAILAYFRDAGEMIRISEKAIILKQFRGIKINDCKLPENFIKLNDYKKRKFILNNKNKYTLSISEEHKRLVLEINTFRKENGIDKLYFNEIINFNDLFFDIYSEAIFYEYKNIFKLANGKYLLKYPTNEFKIKFNNREQNLINILLNDNLNTIIIIEKYNIQFIFLFESQKSFSNGSEYITINKL